MERGTPVDCVTLRSLCAQCDKRLRSCQAERWVPGELGVHLAVVGWDPFEVGKRVVGGVENGGGGCLEEGGDFRCEGLRGGVRAATRKTLGCNPSPVRWDGRKPLLHLGLRRLSRILDRILPEGMLGHLASAQRRARSACAARQAARAEVGRPETLGTRLGPRSKALEKWWDPLESTCRHASLSIL